MDITEFNDFIYEEAKQVGETFDISMKNRPTPTKDKTWKENEAKRINEGRKQSKVSKKEKCTKPFQNNAR